MGAAYKSRHLFAVLFSCEITLAAGLTRFFGCGGGINAGMPVVESVIAVSGISQRLRVFQNTPPGGVETVVYTLMINGLATAQTVTLTGAQQTGVDNVNQVAIADGDRLAIRVVSSVGAAGNTPKASIAVKPYG